MTPFCAIMTKNKLFEDKIVNFGIPISVEIRPIQSPNNLFKCYFDFKAIDRLN